MAAWEIYYWIIVSLICVEALIGIGYVIFYAVTGDEASDELKLIAGAIWCLTLIGFIVAIVVSALNT